MTWTRWWSQARWLLGFARFRTATIMIAIAVMAVALTAVHDYLRPAKVWRRGIHQLNPEAREQAWNQARRGRIDGLDRRSTAEEVGRSLEDSQTSTAVEAVQVYPLIEADLAEVARKLALRLLDHDARVRRVAANSIRYAVRPEGGGRAIAFPALVAALDDPDVQVRRLAARSLGEVSFQVGHDDSFDPRPTLRRKLADPDPEVQLASALAMTYDGAGEEVVPILLEAISGHQEFDRDCPVAGCSVAFEALMVLAPRSDRVLSGLIARVYRESSGRSSETLTTLASAINRDYQARERLMARAVAAIQADNADVRLSGCLVLDRIGEGRQAIPALAQTLDRGTPKAVPYARAALVGLALTQADEIRRVAEDPKLGRESREYLRSLVTGGPMP